MRSDLSFDAFLDLKEQSEKIETFCLRISSVRLVDEAKKKLFIQNKSRGKSEIRIGLRIASLFLYFSNKSSNNVSSSFDQNANDNKN